MTNHQPFSFKPQFIPWIVEEFTTASGPKQQTWARNCRLDPPGTGVWFQTTSSYVPNEKIEQTKSRSFFATNTANQLNKGPGSLNLLPRIPREIFFDIILWVNAFDPQWFRVFPKLHEDDPGHPAPAYRRGSRRALAPWPGFVWVSHQKSRIYGCSSHQKMVLIGIDP
jgi:hypothetical protein